jgi:hypothetical protein
MKRVSWCFVLTFACVGLAQSQTAPDVPGDSIPLIVSKGTPLRIALEKEISVKKVGQPIQGRVVEPVYAFDRLVVPVGSQALGEITQIGKVSKGKRTEGILNANFSPTRDVSIEFKELVLPDGKHLPIETVVSPGTEEVVHLVSTPEKEPEKKNAASKEIEEARREFKREWQAGMSQIKTPGKLHRLKRLAIAELPVRPQYIDAGTRYNAELQEPLDFGSEPYSAEAMSLVGSLPPPGSIVRALLVTPLSSATTQKDAPVEAIVSQPLFSADHHLILPQGSRLKGSVIQAHPAQKLKRNGELRIVFHSLEPAGGVKRAVDASLEGIEAARADNLKLDSEGGAHSTSPKTRYLTTGISIALVASDMHDAGDRTAAGGSGYRLVGALLGLLARSRPFAVGLGAYGAGVSVYSHFLTRGHDVVFPKDMPMDIGFGTRESEAASNGSGPS